jgi:hypothetical protein
MTKAEAQKRRVWKRVRQFMSLESHLVTFRVATPGSSTGRKEQTPVLVVHEVFKTREGNYVVKGVDIHKLTAHDDVEAAYRHYRVDRVMGHITDLGILSKSPYTMPQADERGYVGF